MNILSISLSTSLLILAVVATRAVFIHRLPKKTFLALWALALSRLLLPLSIPSRLNIHNIVVEVLQAALPKEAALPAISPLTDMIVQYFEPNPFLAPALTNIMPDVIGGNINNALNVIQAMPWYIVLWLAGIIIFVLFFLITHLRCRSVYRTALPVDNLFVRQWLEAHPLKRKIRVKLSDKIAAPLAYSVFWPVILMPKDTDWQDEDRLAYILTHEYVHIKRFDAVWKWILAAAVSIHWFNPLMWLMYVLANRDLELSCDETVLRKCGESAKSSYALTLISLAEKRKRLAPLVNNFSKNSVEERIVSIMKMKKTTKFGLLAAMFAVSLIAVVFATSATPSAAETFAENNTGSATTTSTSNSVVTHTTTINDGDGVPTGDYNHISPTDLSMDFIFATPEASQERMLFIIKGENNVYVTYDGINWEPYDTTLENEDWRWWSREEYKEYAESNMKKLLPNSDIPQEKVDNDKARYVQTLKDIKNGIRVSRNKENIYIVNSAPPFIEPEGWIARYCFGFDFTDRYGENVDLGLFETRDQLFAALQQYYEQEVAAGRLTPQDADALYNKIAHPVRMEDEVPLFEKIVNMYRTLDNFANFHL